MATVLLVATTRWFASARTALALSQSGCRVTACCLRGHPFEKTGVLARRFPLSVLAPVFSVLDALRAEMPDLIVACDERATSHLHDLYHQCGLQPGMDPISSLIVRSLGDPRSYSAAASRCQVIEQAAALGVRTPEQINVESQADLDRWYSNGPRPAFLKADGTSGGVGVLRADTLHEARRAYRKLHASPLFLRVAKRTLVNRDPVLLLPFLRRDKPPVSIQRAIAGHEATAAVSCWKGEVLSCLLMEVLERTEPKGPASVLRQIDHPGMEHAVKELVETFGLSGLAGFDFMIERSTGAAYLLEMNLRATQTAHLCMGPGQAPVHALGAKLRGRGTQDLPVQRRREVALFPQEWMRDPNSRYIATGFHDIPSQAPELVKLALGRRSTERLRASAAPAHNKPSPEQVSLREAS